jgi:hypothetical protein
MNSIFLFTLAEGEAVTFCEQNTELAPEAILRCGPVETMEIFGLSSIRFHW